MLTADPLLQWGMILCLSVVCFYLVVTICKHVIDEATSALRAERETLKIEIALLAREVERADRERDIWEARERRTRRDFDEMREFYVAELFRIQTRAVPPPDA